MRQLSFGFKAVLYCGYTFLYLPLVILIIFSFNSSKVLNVWGGFSTQWYGLLLNNPVILNAAYNSLKIATISATLAAILGTITALVLVRFNKLKKINFLEVLMSAPLIMPDIMTGISLLILFVTCTQVLGWPSAKDETTIVLAHTSLSVSYVANILRSRLQDMDRSIEEAAMDLGARPIKVFFVITLPIILPSLCVGWLLAFALSLDDLVIASFLAGPGNTTLPMVVFSSIRQGINPQINVLATLIILILSLGVLAAIFFIKRKEK